MVGAAIGITFGAIQFILLFTAVRSITSDHIRILPLLVQFFCPMAGLLLCAFVSREDLLICALCIIGILIGGAVINFIAHIRRSGGKKGLPRFFKNKRR